MASVALPIIAGRAWYDYRVSLSGTKYTVELRWNSRSEHWTLSLYTADGDPIVVGRRVVVGIPLFRRYRDDRLPAGTLVAVDTTDREQDPGFNDLGNRVQLVYLDPEDEE